MLVRTLTESLILAYGRMLLEAAFPGQGKRRSESHLLARDSAGYGLLDPYPAGYWQSLSGRRNPSLLMESIHQKQNRRASSIFSTSENTAVPTAWSGM